MDKCTYCKKPAEMVCAVCRCNSQSYSYCGRKCQLEDWENHRRICLKSNVLSHRDQTRILKQSELFDSNVNVRSPATTTTSQKQVTLTEMPPSNSTVVIASIAWSYMVFVRSKENIYHEKFCEIVNKLQASADEFKPLHNLPRIGQNVIAKCTENGEYGRALVLKALSVENIRVNFMDYGSAETVALIDLFEPLEEFFYTPRLAVPVLLKGVPNFSMTDEIRALMLSYAYNVDLILKYDENIDKLSAQQIYRVDLFEKSTMVHLNETITDLNKGIHHEKNSAVKKIQDLQHVEIPTDEHTELIITDNFCLNVGCISCTTVDNMYKIEKFQEKIECYAKNLPTQSYKPCIDDLCLAKLNDTWYRGRCDKVCEEERLIYFIDHGNFDLINIKDIRPYPPQFNWPVYTADFMIEGLPENIQDGPLLNRLQEMFQVNNVIRPDLIKKLDENAYVLTISRHLDALKEEELLN